MLDDIYNGRILELAANIPALGRLPDPDGTATAHARLCGSTLTVDVRLGPDGRVSEFAHEVKACLLGQAAASLMAGHAVGMDADGARSLRDRVRAMLKEDGPAPDGAFADFAVLEPIRGFAARHASTLLTFDALVSAIAQAGERLAPREAVA